MPSTERQANGLLRQWDAAAAEMDERECGPEAEHLRSQFNSLVAAQPELFFHVKMETPSRRFEELRIQRQQQLEEQRALRDAALAAIEPQPRLVENVGLVERVKRFLRLR